MKRFLTIVILSVFCLASISQSFADIVVSNSSTFYQDELNKTVQ
jgi:hypothetical protein